MYMNAGDFMIKPVTTQAEVNGMGYVIYKSWQETYTGLIDDSYLNTMSLEKCGKIASFQKDNSLVAVKNGTVVGFVGFGAYRDEKDTDMGEIYGLYVLEEYHGKKIGFNLMNEAVKRLSDYKKIALWVLKGNDKAIRFYERCGFRFDGAEKKVVLGTENTELRMVFERG